MFVHSKYLRNQWDYNEIEILAGVEPLNTSYFAQCIIFDTMYEYAEVNAKKLPSKDHFGTN